MKVPLGWLREFVDLPGDTARLAADLTFAGLAVDAVEGRGDDAVLDLDITTNRVDCMNVYGVAREVSVLYAKPLRALDTSFAEAGDAASSLLSVTVEAPDLCPRFAARVFDVRMGEAPAWMRDRLALVGVRSISNVVDLTNYVMLEMGQPSHAFDLERIPGRALTVRWAREGEGLTTLDGVARTLRRGNGVVGTPDEALALAGVMGGASTEVSEATRLLALEAAYWEPLAIRRSARALGMHTEASHRFERAADPEAPPRALARFAHLLARIGGGSARPGVIDVVAAPRPPRTILFRPARASALLGAPVPEPEMERILAGLGFYLETGGASWRTRPPSWRGDVNREADVIEEVGRHHGVGRIASTLPPARSAEGLRPLQVAERRVRDVLEGAGLFEAITYSFVGASEADAVGAGPALANPLSEDQGVLRTSLVLPGLLGVVSRNRRQGRRDVRVFEIGRVFLPTSEGLPREVRRLGAVLAGDWGEHWSGGRRAVDVFDVKGLLEAVGQRIGVALEATPAGPEDGLSHLHPGQAARVVADDRPLGWFGAIHPEVALRFDLRDAVVAAEIDLEALVGAARGPVHVQPLPRFPAVTRDISVVWGDDRPAAEIVTRARAAGSRVLREAKIVDRFAGPPLGEGKVSLTLSLTFQDPERTLTSQEVQAPFDAIVASLRAAGAEIRGET